MPRRKKTYKPEIINPEDITSVLKNASVMVRNFLDQRVSEALTTKGGEKSVTVHKRFKARSKQTLREITKMYYAELAAYTEPDGEGAPFLLPEELCLSFCAAALLIHLTKVEGKRPDPDTLFD